MFTAEVLSDITRSNDAVDKLLQYKKIVELNYYMLIEPVKKVITLFSKNDQSEWQTEIYNGPEEIINFTTIDVRFYTEGFI